MDLRRLILVLEAAGDEGIGVHDPVHEVGAALDHALVDELAEGFVFAHVAEVIQELVPEAAVDQVSRRMLRTSHIQVHTAPVLVRLA